MSYSFTVQVFTSSVNIFPMYFILFVVIVNGIVFFISLFDILLSGYKNTTNFCIGSWILVSQHCRCPSYPPLRYDMGATFWILHLHQVHWVVGSAVAYRKPDLWGASLSFSLFWLPYTFQDSKFRHVNIWISQATECVELRNLCWVIDDPLVIDLRRGRDTKGLSHFAMTSMSLPFLFCVFLFPCWNN